MEVNWRDDEDREWFLRFKGEGGTPSEQRASMQRQLAALRSSTSFMAPDSWPACSCLVSFRTCEFEDLDGDTYLEAAVNTASLARLDIGKAKLQDMSMSSLADQPGPLGDEVLAAIGQLSSLRELDIGIMLLPQENEFNQALIPASWSALSSLTCVEITKCEGRGIMVLLWSNWECTALRLWAKWSHSLR
jgi:hypothetical protein